MKIRGFAIGFALLVAVFAGQFYFAQAGDKPNVTTLAVTEAVALEIKTDKTSVELGDSFNIQVAVRANVSGDATNTVGVGSSADGYIALSTADGSTKVWLTLDWMGKASWSSRQTSIVSGWTVAALDWATIATVTVPIETSLVGTYNLTGYLVPAGATISSGGSTVALTLTNSATNIPDVVLIKAGTFMMGSTGSDNLAEPDEFPQHQVTISKDFYMGKYEITNAQYCVFINYPGNSDHYDSSMSITRSGGMFVPYSGKENHPVCYVSWTDATHYCQWLSQKTGQTYSLPTEAQWEYAARAGTITRYFCGETIDTTQAHYSATEAKTVGSYPANPWGLYDMNGNVWEWCADLFGAYGSGAEIDPVGPSRGRPYVLRGGGWNYSAPGYLRSAFRNYANPGNRYPDDGFRIAKSL